MKLPPLFITQKAQLAVNVIKEAKNQGKQL
jgi:hypothetical protein